MIMLIGVLLLVLLGVMAVAAKRRGASGGQMALIVVFGTVCTVAAIFGIFDPGILGLRLGIRGLTGGSQPGGLSAT